MLRKLSLLWALLLPCLLLTISCSRAPSVPEANRLLEGRWELVIGHNCSGYGIKSDVLILHGDGRLEQHFVSIYGQRYDSTDQHWSYLPDRSINLDMRKNFLTKRPADGTIGVSIHETLLVEFGKPSVIVLNPDGSCFYRKIAGGWPTLG